MSETLHQEAKAAAKAAELALKDTWGTPQALFDSLNTEVATLKAQRAGVPVGSQPGFTLDICAEQWNTKVPCVVAPDNSRWLSMWFGPGSPTGVLDTLTQGNLTGHDWFGNFPFSQLDKFLPYIWRWYSPEAKAAGAWPGIGYGIMPATRTEQEEWQTYVEPYRDNEELARSMGVAFKTRFITTPTDKSKFGRTKFVPPPGIKPSSPQFGTVVLKWIPL